MLFLHLSRLRQFAGYVRSTRRCGLPLNRHNLRALWIQSEPGWLEKRPSAFEDMTDAEIDAFLEAIE